MRLIAQEAPLGCAIACAASLADLSYKETRRYFDDGEIKEQTSGFYNRDIVNVLNKVGIRTKAYGIKRRGNRKIKFGSIVFIGSCPKYPAGHYLLKTINGWMNPWINFPHTKPIKAGFQKRLSGGARWIIEIIK